MSAFLRADALGAELPFLADLADLEWAVVRAFHATDGPPVGAAELAAIDPAALLAGAVRFQPSVAVRESAWPIRALWVARDAAPGAIDIDLSAGERVLVRRAGFAATCT